MSVIYVLIPLAILLAAIGFLAFLWAVRGGQFDDLDTPPHRALFDDEETPPTIQKPAGSASRGGNGDDLGRK